MPGPEEPASPEGDLSGDLITHWGWSAAAVDGLDTLTEPNRQLEVIYSLALPAETLHSSTILAGTQKREDGEQGLALLAQLDLDPRDLRRNWFSDWRASFEAHSREIRPSGYAHITEEPFEGLLVSDDESESTTLRSSYELDEFSFFVGDQNNNRIIITNFGEYKHFVGQRGGIGKEPHVMEPQGLEHDLDGYLTMKAFLNLYMHSVHAARGMRTKLGRGGVEPHSTGKGLRLVHNIIVGSQPGSAVTRSAAASSGETDAGSPKTKQEAPSNVNVVTPAYTLEDVGGLPGIKQDIQEIAFAFSHPELIEKWGAEKPQGVLLYGEPGTGKTMLAHALANEIGADFWLVQSNHIMQKWLGSSQKNLMKIFKGIKEHEGRLVVFFDEIDSVISIGDKTTGSAAGSERNAVAGLFKQELNTLRQENPNVIIVGATNDLDRIDDSLIRSGRFDYKLYVPRPDDEGRTQIVANTIGRLISMRGEADDIFADDIDVPAVTQATDGMSGADVSEIFRRVTIAKALEEARHGEASAIQQSDLMKAIERFRTDG